MRLLIESAVIFFGTLMAAALMALGLPDVVGRVTTHAAAQPGQATEQAMATALPRAAPDARAVNPGP
ncbi:MAG TPA: hypothetical protein VNN06_01495 [Ramlibacter sp.]|nr:hypothetical protein [Ramlibacter sp.]